MCRVGASVWKRRLICPSQGTHGHADARWCWTVDRASLGALSVRPGDIAVTAVLADLYQAAAIGIHNEQAFTTYDCNMTAIRRWRRDRRLEFAGCETCEC